MKYYLVKNTSHKWSDYDAGDVLYAGYLMTFDINDEDMKDLEVAELERAGPFIPAIYIPNNMKAFVVTEELQKLLEGSQFRGIDFKPVNKKKIVKGDWQKWSQDDFENFIEGFYEPEDILAELEHDDEIACQMPDIFYFEAHILETCILEEDNNGYILKGEPDSDFFLPSNIMYCIVSENLKNFINLNAPNCLSFSEVAYQPADKHLRKYG